MVRARGLPLMEGKMRVPALATAALILLSAAARADGYEPAPAVRLAPSSWEYQFTPYGWLPWVDGDAVIKGRGFTVSQTPIDVLESLDFVWMSYQQAKNGPLTVFSDIMYADLSTSSSFAESKTFSPHVAGTIGAAVSSDYQYWTVEAGGMYEVAKWRAHGGGDPDTTLELLAGGRYWRQELDVDVALAGTVNVDGLVISGTRAIARSGVVEWIDPFLGARLHYVPAPGEEVIVRGDVGGFGAGSKFTWQAIATYNWYLGTHAAIVFDGYLGYKALSVDYQEGSGTGRYEFDVIQQGPVMGITGRF
jgi:hypothetical protein